MYKTIFKRMWPTVIGCFVGVAIFAAILIVTGWADASRALWFAAFVLIVYSCVQFFLTRKEVLEEMLEAHSVNTPLPIVYVDEKSKNNLLYEEPYLDLNLWDKIWGFAIGDIFVSIRNYKESDGEKFRLEDINGILRMKLLSGDRLASIASLPESEDLLFLRKEYKKIKATIMLLNFYDVPAEDFRDERYLCLDDVTDYDSDEFYENGEQVVEQAFTINMAQDKAPNKMELPESASAYVRLIVKCE